MMNLVPLPSAPEGSALHTLLSEILAAWPEHRYFIEKRFSSQYAALDNVSERIADRIVRIGGGDLERFCQDYRWFCQVLLTEEFHFRRTGGYRLSSFADALKEVYNNTNFMSRYTNGILVSQVMWANHTGAFDDYLGSYLAKNHPDYSYLEIGPGHGLLLAEAALDQKCKSVAGWDVSASSLNSTRHCLDAIGIKRPVNLEQHDIFSLSASAGTFDNVVVSEVLEHLEAPAVALRIIAELLKPDGRVFIAVPFNSPAPDHLFLFRKLQDLTEMVLAAGLTIDSAKQFPATGYTQERALERAVTITCALIAKKSKSSK
jgi:2-polyprenyl-3-methyl-5-hydroxy-6-metoxy-1,4-benzoquinol methylase